MNPGTAVTTHRLMEENGLLEKKLTRNDVLLFSLSPKGEKLALLLKLWKEIFQNEISLDPLTDKLRAFLQNELDRHTPKTL